ncbi:MAG: hypothetical protein QM790_04680 [Nibricoccus sp.]
MAGLIVLFAGSSLYHRLTGSPPESALLAEVIRTTGAKGWSFSAIERQETRAPNRADGSLTAKAKLNEPLYTAVDMAAFLQKEFGANVAEFKATREFLASAEGKKVRELAGVTSPPADPLGFILLKQSAAAGFEGSFSGTYDAIKEPSGWRVSVSGTLVTNGATGQPRSSFAPSALIDTDPTARAAIKAKLDEAVATNAKIAAAREQFREQLRRERDSRMESLRGLLNAGSLFTGSVENRYNHQTTPISLEFVGSDVAKGSLQALLRNDGGWQDARSFQGSWKADAEAWSAQVSLRTHYNQAIRDGGPILDASDSWTVTLELKPDGSLEGNTDTYQYRFTRVADAEVAKVKGEIERETQSLLKKFSPETVFVGAAISKRDNSPEKVLLRVSRLENNGVILGASLGSMEHPSWKRALLGTIIGNRYRSDNRPIRLKRDGQDAIKHAPDSSVFRINYDAQISFSLDGDTLRGDDGQYRYELTRASAAEIAQIQASFAARIERFSSIVRTGATYDGVAQCTDGFVTQVRLRFTSVDIAGNSASVVMESREQPGIYTEMKGTVFADEGSVLLRTGKGKYNPKGILRMPLFSQDSTFNLLFQLKDDEMDGVIENYANWRFVLPIKKQAQPPMAAYPTKPGAYVLIGDKWEALPTNGGHSSQSTSSVLSQAGSLLRSLSEPSKEETTNAKLAELLFDGNEPVPAVSGDSVVIAFVGPLEGASAKQLKKYPTLRDYPLMELAPSKTKDNGTRSVDLLRIVPSVAGFVDQRVAAYVESLENNVTLLICTGTLEPGRYALSASSQPPTAYELIVK